MEEEVKPDDSEAIFREICERISEEEDCDVAIYNGPIGRPFDTEIIKKCIYRKKRKNLLLILVTSGGNPDSAFRMARYFQEKYERFTVYVTGYCKSAGTLIALGAHELVMSDHGELGPLDIQMAKKDELIEKQSGLTVMTALRSLDIRAFQAFELFFLQTQTGGGGLISVGTASKIATELVDGLYSPIYGQVDPLHVGEAGRASLIALRYGERLIRRSQNCSERTVQTLATGFPSHGFVIDRVEAAELFANVREPNSLEAALAMLLESEVRLPMEFPGDVGDTPFRFLNEEPKESESDSQEDGDASANGDEGRSASGPSEGSGAGADAADANEQTARKPKRPGRKEGLTSGDAGEGGSDSA